MDNLKGTRQAAPVPARIVIEQQPNGSFTMTHNMKPVYVIGALSMMINTIAGQLANTEALIIDPNKPAPLPSGPVPEPETEKVS